MSEIKPDDLTQAAEAGSMATETPIVAGINEPKAKNTITDFLRKCFSKENLKKTIAVILLAAIVIGGICGVISYNSPKSVALRFAKARFNYDLKVQEKLLAYDFRAVTLYANDYKDDEAFFESLSDEYNEDIYSWEEYFKVYQKQHLEDREDDFGNSKITCEVSRIKDISERKVKDENTGWLSFLETIANFDADAVGDGKNVTVKVKAEGEDIGIIRYTFTVVLVKVSNSWKVLDWDVE